MANSNDQGNIKNKFSRSSRTLLNDDIAPFLLTALVESADDAIISKNLDGVITSWNHGAERIFGWTSEEAVGQSILILIPPEHQSEEKVIIGKIRAGERVEHFETIRRRKNGSLINVSITVSPIKSADGTIIGASKIARDITEQKRAEAEREQLVKQLEIERSRLTYLFEKAPAFVAATRGVNHVFEIANPAYLELVGRRDVIGKSADQILLTPEIVDRVFFDPLDQVYQTGEPYIGRELSILIQRKENQPPHECFVDFVYQPIFEVDGSVSGIFIHGIDITEQVQARRDAESANRAKDEFLATLSHELRTPMNAILGWSSILKNDQLQDDARQNALQIIQRNAQIQSNLIEDILDVSRIISGKLKLEAQPLELSSLVEAVIETVLPTAQTKNIRIQSVLDSVGKSIVFGDQNRLQQAIWNLLSNAVKFTPKGGRVQIRLERVNSHIELIVTDSGEGVPPEVLPFIFDRFRQADSSITRKYGGLGLGLAIVRHIVEMHGGTVEAENQTEGQGAIFTIKLPLLAIRSADLQTEETNNHRAHPTAPFAGNGERRHSSTASVAAKYTPELTGLHVLVVDDEPDGRSLVTMVLERCGAKVTEAGSAADAFEAVRELRPDVLISDLGMPEEDGYSLIEKVRALPADQGGHIPAAALTAYARLEDRMRVLRSGFQIHLPKPVDPAELLAVVANLSERRRSS